MRLPGRLSVVRAVTQVRQPEPPAGQGRGGHPPLDPSRRSSASVTCPDGGPGVVAARDRGPRDARGRLQHQRDGVVPGRGPGVGDAVLPRCGRNASPCCAGSCSPGPAPVGRCDTAATNGACAPSSANGAGPGRATATASRPSRPTGPDGARRTRQSESGGRPGARPRSEVGGLTEPVGPGDLDLDLDHAARHRARGDPGTGWPARDLLPHRRTPSRPSATPRAPARAARSAADCAARCATTIAATTARAAPRRDQDSGHRQDQHGGGSGLVTPAHGCPSAAVTASAWTRTEGRKASSPPGGETLSLTLATTRPSPGSPTRWLPGATWSPSATAVGRRDRHARWPGRSRARHRPCAPGRCRW